MRKATVRNQPDNVIKSYRATGAECDFRYRGSAFSDTNKVILGAKLELQQSTVEAVEARMEELQESGAEHAMERTDRIADLFAPDVCEEHANELQKNMEEQQQLDEQWEQLAAILAERLLCPGA